MESTLVYGSLDFQPFHFIPKVSPEMTRSRLEYVVNKLISHISAMKKIEIPVPYGIPVFISPADILFLKSSGNYVEYHLQNKDTVTVRRKLDEALGELSPYLFLRLHKSYAVNMGFIEKINFPGSRSFYGTEISSI